MHNVRFIDLGMKDYQESWDFQTKIFNQVWEAKKQNNSTDVSTNYLLFCEHPHVYTLGKSGKDANLLINEEQLKSYGASFYKIDRGGDITYHGPGQIVGYPIFDLEVFKLGVKEYVHKIEEAIIVTLHHYGISSTRLQGATGVWLDADKPTARKICAIGVKAGHFITMHGFAFNINTNLNFFNHINPCGFVDKGVTSLSNELGRTIDIEEVKRILLTKIEEVFGFSHK